MSQCPTCGGWNDPNVPGLCHACLCKQPDPPPAAVETAYLDLGTLNLKTGKRTPPDPPATGEPARNPRLSVTLERWKQKCDQLAEARDIIEEVAFRESLEDTDLWQRARAWLARTAGGK